MSKLLSIKEKKEISALVAFTDLTLFMKTSQGMEDAKVAQWMDEFFEKTSSIVMESGGVVVKFIGDAALIVFEEELVDVGVQCLLKIKDEIDAWLTQQGYKSRLEVKAHFGKVIAGPFGSKGDKKFDVIGKTVNTAATLQAKPFAISTQAFRQLSSESRKLFKKHTPPVAYIRTSDRHNDC
jgi:class 3 adenylate cyclase